VLLFREHLFCEENFLRFSSTVLNQLINRSSQSLFKLSPAVYDNWWLS
jgi:hypothetical protein